MNAKHKIDMIDLRILDVLQRDGRIKNIDLAEQVSLSASPCLQRVKRLENLGYIRRYQAVIEVDKLVETIEIFTQVTLKEHTLEKHRCFETQIAKVPEVIECYLSSGGFDYFIKFICRSIVHYQDTIDKILDSEIGVNKYHSFVTLKKIVSNKMLSLERIVKVSK